MRVIIREWFEQEVAKHQNAKQADDSYFYWIRMNKGSEQNDFFDRISNGKLVVALMPVFLVLVLILNLIA